MLVSTLEFTQPDASYYDHGKPAIWVIDSLSYEIKLKKLM